MDSSGPRLPWEVIERAIDNLSGHRETLQRLALTCHQLLPRTRVVMFAHVAFKDRDHVFAFINFLQENPHLVPVVRSIAVWPPDLAPFPLLHILPNLSEIEFRDGRPRLLRTSPELYLHYSSLTCVQRFGTSIRTLHLSRLQFKTYMSFARMLLAFVHITHLVCDRVIIGGPQAPSQPEMIKRLTERMELKALTVNSKSLVFKNGQTKNLSRLLLDSSNWVSSKIENLTFWFKKSTRHEFVDIVCRCDWSSLRSLNLLLPLWPGNIGDIEFKLLKGLRKWPSLTDVTLEWQGKSLNIAALCRVITVYRSAETLEKFEDALLAFSKPRFICSLDDSPRNNNGLFWLGELRKCLPALSQRGAVTLRSGRSELSGAGHDYFVHTLAFSPDSKWVASGSRDSTIILWDVNNGTIAQRWVAHGYSEITTIAFSADSQYVLSGGSEDNEAAIWDLSQEPRKVATLEAGAPHVPGKLHAHISECAWSPDGRTIATGSRDGTVQLWDARTFGQQALHTLGGEVTHLIFSPNGCWLICRTYHENQCSVLDVALGTPHKRLNPHGHVYLPTDDPLGPPSVHPFRARSAAFDPTGTRLAVKSDPTNYILDVETGDTLLVLNGGHEEMYNISFSPDGRLLLGQAFDKYYIWDAFTGTELSHVKGRYGGTKFSPCGKYIASTSDRNTLRLWRTSDRSCLATLSEHEDMVFHVVFSPDGKMLSSADSNGRVIIRRMRDILPPFATQDADPALIAPSLPPVIDPTPYPSPPDHHAGIYPDEETDPEKLRFTPEREEVGEPEERRIDEDAASSRRAGPQQSTTSAFFGQDEEGEESAARDSPVAGHQRAVSAARPRSGDSLATTSGPIAVDGDGSASSARLPSVAAVDREALGERGQPPAREAQEDVNSAVPLRASTSARQEKETRIQGNMADSGRLGLQQPIADAYTQRDGDGDDSAEGNSAAADGANLDARVSPEISEAAVENLSTDAIRPSFPSFPTPAEHEASTSRGLPLTRDVWEDVNGAVPPQAPTTAGQENTDSGPLGLRQAIASASIQQNDDGDESVDENSLTVDRTNLDVRASPKACEAAVEDLSTDAIRPSFPTPTVCEASASGGQPPSCDAQADANSEDDVEATPTVGQEKATCSDGAMAGDGRAESARCSSSGDSATRLSSIEHGASRDRGQPPTHAAQEDANSEVQVQASPAGGQKNATCSDSAMARDGRAGSADRSSVGDSTTSSARLSSLTPAEREASGVQGLPSACEASEDTKAPAQAQATPSIEQKDREGSAVSAIASPMDRAANEPERRGVVDICATPGHTPVPEGGSGQQGKSVTRVLKAVGMNIRGTARQVASGAKECWAKLTTFGIKMAQQRRELRVSASMS